MSTERAFLLLIKPDSKKPSAGIISITSPVEISIHEVSPGFIVNIHQNFAIPFTLLGIKIDNLLQEEFLFALIKCWRGYKLAKNEGHEKVQHCSKGIRKFQKELGLKVEIFPNLHIWLIDGDTKQMSIQAESK